MYKIKLFLISILIHVEETICHSSSTGVSGAIHFLVDIQEPKQAKFPAFEL
jgi:hypothetical protein